MHSMLKKDFWYDLPKELIAQEPASPRDAARLMVLSQKDDSIQHKVFRDLPEFLEPGDLLVVNNSKEQVLLCMLFIHFFYQDEYDCSLKLLKISLEVRILMYVPYCGKFLADYYILQS